MANWNEYVDRALSRLSRKKRKPPALPQLTLQAPEPTGAIVAYEEPPTQLERQVKQRLSYRLFEKMRRRSLSWKSYYYYDEYNIPRLAITNDNATGTHIIERNYFIPEDRIVEANFYTDENASKILIDVNDLEEVHRNLFDQIRASAIKFQVYDKTYPMLIWFDTSREPIPQSYQLGRHKICINVDQAYLLRPFRNLGAEGFAALANRLLAQEGIAVDPKNIIESLLIELGHEELLRHYQSALSQYNQQTSMRLPSATPMPGELPLIITKARGRGGSHDADKSTADGMLDAIPDDAYERLALVFDNHFEETEEDLLNISLAALSLDRSSVVDSCTILKDKLRFYSETALLQDHQLEHFYRFMQQLIAEDETADTDEVEYSPLEDQAYEEILIEVLEELRDISTDPRYTHYLPIQAQTDALQDPIESLTLALEDAEDKQRHREIHDKREILTKKPFELPNSQTYSRDKGEGEQSYYERLLEVQKSVKRIQDQLNYAVYNVSFSLAKSAYLLTQSNLKQSPDRLQQISNQLVELMKTEPEGDYNAFEQNFVEVLSHLASDVYEILGGDLSNRLAELTARLERICSGNEQYAENEWTAEYLGFVRSVPEFNEQVRQQALEGYNRIAQQIDYQFQLIETFISGISVPALLPAQLHESGTGLQTFLVQQLQQYLNTQNLQLHTVPGQESQLRSLINELMPKRLETPLEQLEYFFMCVA